KYKISSEDLELVTILETICLDGKAPVPPRFVFKSANFCPEWFAEGHHKLYA
ncbi:hypothetical protein B0H17DRAFT_865384, partial [Mycena rosella]